MSHEIIAVDIGGTNARFCRARIGKGSVPQLGTIRKYKVAEHPTLADAWRHFARDEADALPDEAVVALAAPVTSGPIKLTNSDWIVDPAGLKDELGLDRLVLVNDFEAMAHGVMALPRDRLTHMFGPDEGLPAQGTVSIVGPGTGLGVGLAACDGGAVRIVPTEGGHLGFAPVDEEEDGLLARLRQRFGRVSVERVVSGPGLGHIHAVLADRAGIGIDTPEDAALWQAALDGRDDLAVAALSQLCKSYGAVAGDIALAHGAAAVVLAGGLTGRMKDNPAFALFHENFLAKGRHRHIMEALPVYHADHPEPGLFGAAAAGATRL
ncbi:MAG: glucokinase [Sphingobium sp.]